MVYPCHKPPEEKKEKNKKEKERDTPEVLKSKEEKKKDREKCYPIESFQLFQYPWILFSVVEGPGKNLFVLLIFFQG